MRNDECRVLRVALPGEATAARQGRAVAREVLADEPAEVVDVITLLVSELVTNAVRYSPGLVVLEVAACPDLVRVGVCDANPAMPHFGRDAALGDESGRGLAIVAALASRCGADLVGNSKRVWAELDLVPAA